MTTTATRPVTYDTKGARREWERRWGFKVGTSSPCPTRVLLRRRCPGEGCCWWSSTSHLHAFDHIYSITRLRTGQRGILTMPYGLTDEDAVELAAWCGERSCRYTVLGTGWHFPGTVAIIIFPYRGEL